MDTQAQNDQLAIIVYTPDIHDIDRFIDKRLMHFKAAASYAAKIVTDPMNYKFTGRGKPMWKHNIEVMDSSHYLVAKMRTFGDVQYDTVIEHSDIYPAVQYVMAAIRNAAAEVTALANQEMTPTEIETELNLTPGVVRKYIHDHRTVLEADRIIRHADKRTVLMRRGFALSRWGRQGENLAVDTPEFQALMKNWEEGQQSLWVQIEALDFGDEPRTKTQYADYYRTKTVQLGDFGAAIEKVVTHENSEAPYYRVETWNLDSRVRNHDMVIQNLKGRIAIDYDARVSLLGRKLKALAAFGIH